MAKLSLLICVALSSYLQVSQAGRIALETGTRVCDIYYERNNVCDVTNVGLKVRETSIRSCRCADRTWMRCEMTTRNCRPAPSTIVALGMTAAKEPEPQPELPAAVVSVEIPSEVAVASKFAVASEAAIDVMLGHREELEVTNEGPVQAAPLEDVVVSHVHIHDDNDPTDHLHHQDESTKEIAVDINNAHEVTA